MTREAFLSLPIEEQSKILEGQCTKEIRHHYEVTCPECGNYYAGHATGGLDICTCEAEIKRADALVANGMIGQLRRENTTIRLK